jgi:hypothetical protein
MFPNPLEEMRLFERLLGGESTHALITAATAYRESRPTTGLHLRTAVACRPFKVLRIDDPSDKPEKTEGRCILEADIALDC